MAKRPRSTVVRPRVPLGEFPDFPSASIYDLLHPFTRNLVIVSTDNSLTASISHGTESGASASAEFGGVSLIIDVYERIVMYIFPFQYFR